MIPPASVPDFASASLADLAAWADGDSLPPVDEWRPAREGRVAIRIAADGRWFHEGGEIERPAMVRLFSRVLRREPDGTHVLVTPAEKLAIEVDDAPFVAVEARVEGDGARRDIAFRLNTGDVVLLGPRNPLRLRDGPAGRLPYLHVRGRFDRAIEARLARPVYYELAGLADDQGCIVSGGERFVLGDAA